MTIDAPIEIIPLHIRGGSILPMQQPNRTSTSRFAAFLYNVVAVKIRLNYWLLLERMEERLEICF